MRREVLPARERPLLQSWWFVAAISFMSGMLACGLATVPPSPSRLDRVQIIYGATTSS